ncbi:MAG: ATP-grasp domain-containing protein [Planctomycetaceae bacterium]|nr:ATP-grasp domain-containing protein [Planctomycetaceae bacterium]
MTVPSSDDTSAANGRASDEANSADVIIVGASARSAAFSAIRAGLRPLCIDQFADVDLQAVAPVVRVDDYPDGLIAALKQFPPLPVIYTGAMENHPQVLRAIESRQPLLGNNADIVQAVRDPLQVHEVLSGVNMPCLEVRDESDPPPADGAWLLKPRNGSGGRGIVIWDDEASGSPTLKEPHYYQQKASGTRISAVYVGTEDPGSLRYVGLTRQLMGRSEVNAGPFNWCGSVGPIIMDPGGEILIRRTGAMLAHRFGLRGIFGCDFIMENATTPLLTEVNPRYTSSVEVLEVLAETNLIHDHCLATGFEMPEGRNARVLVAPRGAVLGKMLLYADRDVTIPDMSNWQLTGPFGPIPAYADVPATGSFAAAGSPVCTVLAAAAEINQCIDYMQRRTADVASVLVDASPQS